MNINQLASLASALGLDYTIANDSIMVQNKPFNPRLNSHQIWDLVRVLEIDITFELGYVKVGNSSYPTETVDLPQAVVNAAVDKLTCNKS